jgi:hypothetical protein
VSGIEDYLHFTGRYYSNVELSQELDDRKCKYTFGFLMSCPCCNNFSGKTVHLVSRQAFKNPWWPCCGNYSKCDDQKGLTLFIPYMLLITFIKNHWSHRNFPQIYTFQTKSFKIQVKQKKLNMVLDKMPAWIVWWGEEPAVMATFYHFRYVLVTKKAIIILTLEVLVEVNTETAVFFNVMPHSLVDAYQPLGGTCCLHPWWETKPQPHL